MRTAKYIHKNMHFIDTPQNSLGPKLNGNLVSKPQVDGFTAANNIPERHRPRSCLTSQAQIKHQALAGSFDGRWIVNQYPHEDEMADNSIGLSSQHHVNTPIDDYLKNGPLFEFQPPPQVRRRNVSNRRAKSAIGHRNQLAVMSHDDALRPMMMGQGSLESFQARGPVEKYEKIYLEKISRPELQTRNRAYNHTSQGHRRTIPRQQLLYMLDRNNNQSAL